MTVSNVKLAEEVAGQATNCCGQAKTNYTPSYAAGYLATTFMSKRSWPSPALNISMFLDIVDMIKPQAKNTYGTLRRVTR